MPVTTISSKIRRVGNAFCPIPVHSFRRYSVSIPGHYRYGFVTCDHGRAAYPGLTDQALTRADTPRVQEMSPNGRSRKGNRAANVCRRRD